MKRYVRLLFFYVLFIFLNIALNRLMGLLHIPLFLDNVGTLLAACLGGYLPGVLVGYLTNIINSTTTDLTNAYYAGMSVLIAVSATFLYRRGYFNSFWKALISIPVFAVIGGGLGSLLTYFIYGFGVGEGISAPFARALLKRGTLSVFWAQFISDMAIDLPDKAATVLLAYLCYKLIPTSIRSSLRFTNWQQNPLTPEERLNARKTVTRGRPLRSKITVIIAILMLVVALVTTTISYVLYQHFTTAQYTNTGRSLASLVASAIDGDSVDRYLAEGTGVPGYRETEEGLKKIKENSPYLSYLYVYQIREDGCHTVFDLDSEFEGTDVLGMVVPFDESFAEYIPALLKGERIEPLITKDTYGWLLTNYEPVYDSRGNCVCYACTDIDMNTIRLEGISFIAKILSLFLGFFILVLVLSVCLANYHLTYPIAAMTFASESFAYNNEETIETSVQRLKSLDIRTGDELESLYKSLVQTISETVGYIDDIQKKSAEIQHMQDGLIYIMADLVESRDQNTGDHVRKTAAYVKLILELLKENHLYEERLTDEFAHDVISSAPLHDVGKIKVSDTILNKPGKLTDDEFTAMKSHTLAGKDVIESAMKLTSDPGYLREAANLATYHHEKWNGSGYPKGLKGEEIPLSARIMAVSDVFDALVSRRSYKEPFTFEQAMNIIREGAGTHFDPLIAKVFVDNADRVRKVFEELT